MINNMHNYGVYVDAVDIVFDEEELEDSDVEDEHTNANNSQKFRNLTDTERQQIYEALPRGKLKKNTTNIVAQMF